jgi:cytochrome o ubiquinol oxidase operon protein cyoD
MSSNTEHLELASHDDELAPGFEESGATVREKVRDYLIGLALAVLLTIASFWSIHEHVVYGPGIPVLLVTLAIAQMGIHLVFFPHITSAPDNTNNILALAFGILIVGLILFGSVWIMSHLNHRLMPMQGLM